MPRHRGLTLKKLVKAIGAGLMERYFTEKVPEDIELPHRIIMDLPAVEEFMADPRNVEAKGWVQQDLRKINDICDKGKNLLVRAYKYFEIEWKEGCTPESMAMRLFLDHKEAFDYAYTWYCYYRASSKMSHHNMPGDFNVTEGKLDVFRAEVRDWFKGLAKGTECMVTHYNEEDKAVFLIKHGSYVRTVAYWKEDKIEITSFRPANEDLFFYNKEIEVLSVKASLQKDREQYIRSFSRCIMGDESLADSEGRDTIYTLKPLQDGSFNWDGNENVKRVILTEVRLKLQGDTEPVIKVSSKDVRKTLAQDFSDVGLDTCELTYVHFRFILDVDGYDRAAGCERFKPEETQRDNFRLS